MGNYKNNLSLHIHFFLFERHYSPDRVVGITTYLRLMAKAAKKSDCGMRNCKIIETICHCISFRVTESEDHVHADNAMRDCF